MSVQSLNKEERLKSKALIEEVFASGKSKFAFPIKLLYIRIENFESPSRFLFGLTVPKRLHRNAVTRNLIKRRIREAYRKNKPILPAEKANLKCQYACMYIYVNKKVSQYKDIEKAMVRLNKELTNSIHPRL